MDRLPPNYYELLGLQSKQYAATLSPQDVRAAYRQALLRHHPDKTAKRSSEGSERNGNLQVSVDDIALAYKTLSDARLRAEYDRWLQNAESDPAATGLSEKPLRTGLETVDLDDLVFDKDAEVWTRSCRCGEEKGYVISEGDLEANVDDGEVIIGCKGCSLWLRVLFSVAT